VPTIDNLSVRVLVDSASDLFFKPQQAGGVKTEPGRSFTQKAQRQMPGKVLTTTTGARITFGI
jgi:hypothetical protein